MSGPAIIILPFYENVIVLPYLGLNLAVSDLSQINQWQNPMQHHNGTAGKELWPAVAQALKYCRWYANDLVESESEEMEGRLPTGKANLSTSLPYRGLPSGAHPAQRHHL
jgi:hypothetical protein